MHNVTNVKDFLIVFRLFFFFGDLERRDLSHKEKLYLRELNVITETQCTLGNALHAKVERAFTTWYWMASIPFLKGFYKIKKID